MRTEPVASSTATTTALADGFAESYCKTYHNRAAPLKWTSKRRFATGIVLPLESVAVLNPAALASAAACTARAVKRGGTVAGSLARGGGTGASDRVMVLDA